MFCKKCGTENLDAAKFCKSCGSQIKKKKFTKKQKLIAVIFGIVLVLVVGGFVINNTKQKNQVVTEGSVNLNQVQKTVPASVTQVQSLKDETADWKIYSNVHFGGVEIKYPPGLTYKEINATDAPSIGYAFAYFKKKSAKDDSRYPTIDLGYFPNDDNLPLDTWIKQHATKSSFNETPPGDIETYFYGFDWSKVKPISVGALNGYRFMNSASSSDYQDYVLFSKGNLVLYVRSVIVSNGNLEEDFNKMFPTFKFTK